LWLGLPSRFPSSLFLALHLPYTKSIVHTGIYEYILRFIEWS
jgi:hypothetical protein